jgi:hypothetical protein
MTDWLNDAVSKAPPDFGFSGPARRAGPLKPKSGKYCISPLADQSSFHRRGVGGDVYSLSKYIYAAAAGFKADHKVSRPLNGD